MPPHHVGALDGSGTPPGGRQVAERVDDGAHVHVDPFDRERGDALVIDATGDDLGKPPEIGGDVQREPVHRAAAAEPHSDGGNLPRRLAVGVDPDAGMTRKSCGADEAELGQRVDEQLLDTTDVGGGVGHSAPPFAGNREDRISDQLSRAVEGDVAATVHAKDVGAAGPGLVEHVARIGAEAECVHRIVFEQQQVVVGGLAEQRPLEGPGVAVVDPPQPPHSQHAIGGRRLGGVGGGSHRGAQISASQLRVSMMVRSRSRNAAA